jgi:hypothetical protein
LPSGEYDFDNTKIVISDVIPQENAFWPCIVVNTVVGQEQRYLGPDGGSEVKDNSGTVVQDNLLSSIPLTVQIQAYTIDDTIARDEIIDQIYQQFKTLTDDLAANGIELWRDSFVAENRVFINDRWAITAGIQLEVYTEWTQDLGPGTTLAKIPVDISVDL